MTISEKVAHSHTGQIMLIAKWDDKTSLLHKNIISPYRQNFMYMYDLKSSWFVFHASVPKAKLAYFCALPPDDSCPVLTMQSWPPSLQATAAAFSSLHLFMNLLTSC